MHLWKELILGAMLLTACGGEGSPTDEAGGTTSSGSTSSGSGGASGTGSSTSSGEGDGGQAPAPIVCGGHIDLTDNGGPMLHFGSICLPGYGNGQSSEALGYRFLGPTSHGQYVEGCSNPEPKSPGISIAGYGSFEVPYTFMNGTARYVDSDGNAWVAKDSMTFTVTKEDEAAHTLEGSFSIQMPHGSDPPHTIEGAFVVCEILPEPLF